MYRQNASRITVSDSKPWWKFWVKEKPIDKYITAEEAKRLSEINAKKVAKENKNLIDMHYMPLVLKAIQKSTRKGLNTASVKYLNFDEDSRAYFIASIESLGFTAHFGSGESYGTVFIQWR